MPLRSLSRKRLTQLIIGAVVGGTAIGYGGYKGSQKLGLINPPTNVVVNAPPAAPGGPSGGGGFALTCTQVASDGNSGTVQTMLNSATAGSSGSPNVYCIPQGTWHWATHVTWTQPAYTVLLGEGALNGTGSPGLTVIYLDYPSLSPTFEVTTQSTGTGRIAGITWKFGDQGATTSVNIASIATGTNPVVTTASPHGFSGNDVVYLAGMNATPALPDSAYAITVINATSFSIDGFTVTGAGNAGTARDWFIKEIGNVDLFGTNHSYRFDHNTIDATSGPGATNGYAGKGFRTFGWIYGVMDHNQFYLPSNNQNGTMFGMDAYGGHTEGDGAWADTTQNGTVNWWFVEDNTFTGSTKFSTADDCHDGAKVVWRYNTMSAAQIQTHPTGGSGPARGCRAYEVYGNTVTFAPATSGNAMYNFFFLSSGPAIMFDNSVQGAEKFVSLNAMRRSNATYPESAPPNGWGYCGTDQTGSASAWDGNQSADGYPCLDMPGQAGGDLISGSFPTRFNTTTGTVAWPHQTTEGIYEWNNTHTCSGCDNVFFVGESSVGDFVIAQNRDYWLAHGNSSCNQGAGSCTAGVGRGTRAQRPANCTTGVAWWSTDQGGNWNTSGNAFDTGANDGTLDKCTATNTWTNGYYTPYAYPHPLRS